MDCSECVFRRNNSEGLQIGCEVGRLAVMQSLGVAIKTNEDSFFSLNRFCNCYRDEKWNYPETIDAASSKVRSEIMPTFGVVIKDNGDVFDVSLFEQSLRSVLSTKWPVEKLRIILSTTKHRDMPAIAHLVNSTQKSYSVDVRAVFHHISEQKVKDWDRWRKLAAASYFVTINAGAELKLDTLDVVNNSLNTDLEQIVLFEFDGVSIVRSKIMKSVYLNFNDYNLALDYIRSIAKKDGMYMDLSNWYTPKESA